MKMTDIADYVKVEDEIRGFIKDFAFVKNPASWKALLHKASDA